MLKDEQAVSLLRRAETVLQQQLPILRGHLAKAEHRSGALWELLVIDEASRLGQIDYEPHDAGRSPDLQLHLPNSRSIWLEATFLYQSFWEQERVSNELIRWIYGEAVRHGIDCPKIEYRLDGDPNNLDGPKRNLPALHEIKRCMKEAGLLKWFKSIQSQPLEQHNFAPSQYSLTLYYRPHAVGRYVSGGGLVQETPKTITRHAVYIKMREKAKQCKVVGGPNLILIGSDQSSAVSSLASPGLPTFQKAVMAAFAAESSLSAVIIVQIGTPSAGVFERPARRARAELFVNPYAASPLTQQETDLFRTMNFNRWRYTYPLDKWEHQDNDPHRSITGTLTYKMRDEKMELEIPANIVVQALAGQTTLAKAFSLKEDDPVVQALRSGWLIESCSMKESDVEAAESTKVILRMTPPLPSMYWPEKRKN